MVPLVLVLGLLFTVLELSAASRGHAPGRRPASVAGAVRSRSAEPSVPNAPETEEAPSSTSPTITY